MRSNDFEIVIFRPQGEAQITVRKQYVLQPTSNITNPEARWLDWLLRYRGCLESTRRGVITDTQVLV